MRILILSFLLTTNAHAIFDQVQSNELSLLVVPSSGEVNVQADQVELFGRITLYGDGVSAIKNKLDQHLSIIIDSMAVLKEDRVELRLGELNYKDEKFDIFTIQKALSVFVSDLSVLDRVTTTLDDYGWKIEGTSWTASNEDHYRENAYLQACSNARSKADLLAKELGVKIIGVHRVYVDGLSRRSTGYRYRRVSRATSDMTNIQINDEGALHARGGRSFITNLTSKEVKFTQDVNVEFLIKRIAK